MDKKQKKFMADDKKFAIAMKTIMIMRINEKRLLRNLLVFVTNSFKQQVMPSVCVHGALQTLWDEAL